jgi:hypothetical protein
VMTTIAIVGWQFWIWFGFQAAFLLWVVLK